MEPTVSEASCDRLPLELLRTSAGRLLSTRDRDRDGALLSDAKPGSWRRLPDSFTDDVDAYTLSWTSYGDAHGSGRDSFHIVSLLMSVTDAPRRIWMGVASRRYWFLCRRPRARSVRGPRVDALPSVALPSDASSVDALRRSVLSVGGWTGDDVRGEPGAGQAATRRPVGATTYQLCAWRSVATRGLQRTPCPCAPSPSPSPCASPCASWPWCSCLRRCDPPAS